MHEMIPAPLETIRGLIYAGDLSGARSALSRLEDQPGDILDNPARAALEGLLLLRCGEREAGRARLEAVQDIVPTTSAWAADLGGALLLLGSLGRAVELLELAVALPDPGPTAFNRLATARLAQGEAVEAERFFRQALALDPKHTVHYLNLGNLLVQSGQLDEALVCFDQALVFGPGMEAAVQARNQLLVAMDRAGEVIGELEEQLEREPDSLSLRCRMADLLDGDGRFREAVAVLEEARRLAPEDVGVCLQLARLLLSRTRLRPALAVLREAERLAPENPAVLTLLVTALIESLQPDLAEEVVERLFASHPGAPQSFLARAELRGALDDAAGAESDLRQALALMPASVEALNSLGHLLMQAGRIEEAVDCFKRAAALNPATLAALIEARSFPDDPRVIEMMRAMVANPLLPRGPKISLAFALARLSERQGEYELAFDYADQANRLSRKTMLRRCEQHHRLTREMTARFTGEFHRRFRGCGSRSERPVFVVGMPRSGTTLVEQMLSSHPEVFGGGELGFIPALVGLLPKVIESRLPYPACLAGLQRWMLAQAASNYLSKIAKLDSQAVRVVDKLPHNFLHLGLINLIFPRARIIHVRRDPRDVAVSNYFTNFKHKHGGMAYAFDLADIGRMLNDHRRIMEHWREVLPAGVLFELDYEELVEHPEGMGRQLCEFLGLSWHDGLLAFHRTERPVKTASVWQVRQPLYRSSRERWRHYEKQLQPLLAVLAEYPPQFG